ncbi:MAG: hypothetical protein AAF432_11995 [Planctomycetota bacterium]
MDSLRGSFGEHDGSAITSPAPTVAALPGPWRSTLARLTAMGVRSVQLSATQAGFRPRELDRSGRRDLLTTLRRAELSVAGLDAWIPADHFIDATHSDRAVDALRSIVELAADLGRVPVSMTLPSPTDDDDAVAEIAATIAAHAERHGVGVIDHMWPKAARGGIAWGLETAAALSHDSDPTAMLLRDAPASVRLADLDQTGMRGPIGTSGRLDVLAFRVSLSMSTSVKHIVMDTRQWIQPWEGLDASIRAWSAATMS